jgi:hypothetical protein
MALRGVSVRAAMLRAAVRRVSPVGKTDVHTAAEEAVVDVEFSAEEVVVFIVGGNG